MLDWLIIGGGIHGVHLAHALIHRKNWPADRVRILDPHPELLHVWSRQTASTGMTFLRSPVVHHIGLPPSELQQCASRPPARSFAKFALPYRRPSLRLFNHHALQTIETHRLDRLHIQSRANALSLQNNHISIETQTGRLDARRVLLATGQSTCDWPDWANVYRHSHRIHHVLDPEFQRDDLPDWQHAVVVGGGLSASQVARALARERPGTVTLLSRQTPSVHQFDADPGWMGPKYLTGFRLERDYEKRRAMIRRARHRGSITPNEAFELRTERKRGLLTHCIANIACVSPMQKQTLELRLDSGDHLAADLIILATGFQQRRPGTWLDPLVEQHDLPCAPCGYPIVNQQLRWHKNLFVAGPLAELELGPPARNILGARHAAQRLLTVE